MQRLEAQSAPLSIFWQKLLLVAALAAAAAMPLPGFSQSSPSSTLRNPLIQGAPSSQAFSSARQGQPPPMGDGSTPTGVTPGMGGPPTLIPSVPMLPANHISSPSATVQWEPSTQSAPGEAGPGMQVPPAPSTPGEDPQMLHAPLQFRHPPAREVNINPNGGISGSAPTERWGGQTTGDYGLYRKRGTRTIERAAGGNRQVSEDGPGQTRENAQPTYDQYGRRLPQRNGQQSVQTIAPY